MTPQANNPAPDDAPQSGREVLLCVTGGVACFKAAALASMMVRAGLGVSVAMTEAATQFVAPLSFQAVTGRAVHTSMWASPDRYDPHHISLTDAADLVVVAPATANSLAKTACGLADDLVSTLLCASLGARPILVAPAMNTRMWLNPAVQRNVETLRSLAVQLVGPESGRMACGTTGPGRMAEPADILAAATDLLSGPTART
jgi:phosphopantothenoylcysteine decarboxylase/phosphopantothenate--cysteine ligase